MSFTLYGDLGSGAFCVEAALTEAGAAYEFQPISLEKDEQRSDAFRLINPSGKVPALKSDDGEILTETAAILLTLAARYPEAHLLPAPESPDYAKALRWIAFLAGEVYPAVEISDYPERFVAEQKGAAILKFGAKRRIRERMAAVEEAASDGPWFLASGFSLADIYVTMFSRWRDCRSEGWRENNLPKICAIAAGLAARERLKPVFEKHFPNG
jgi:Glutathione S-transferase